jgi:hypothetical protein
MIALQPDQMTTEERLAELAALLATGLIRLQLRKSSPLSAHLGECSLDCAANQSGHADPNSLEVEA